MLGIHLIKCQCFISLRPEQPIRPKTHCEQHRDSVQTTSPEGYPITGAYVPQCDPSGQYTSKQVSIFMRHFMDYYLANGWT